MQSGTGPAPGERCQTTSSIRGVFFGMFGGSPFFDLRLRVNPKESHPAAKELMDRDTLRQQKLADVQQANRTAHDLLQQAIARAEAAETRVAEIQEDRDELQASFDLRWKCDMRAI